MTVCILLFFTQSDDSMGAIVKKTNCILLPYTIFLIIVRKSHLVCPQTDLISNSIILVCIHINMFCSMSKCSKQHTKLSTHHKTC